MTEGGTTLLQLVVPADMDQQRADRVVATLLDVSRAVARLAVDEGRVRRGDTLLGPADKLAAGTSITVERLPEAAGIEPLDAPLTTRYESASTIVVDKPPGLVVHPGAGHRNDTLASILIFHYPELEAMGEEHRWGLVHRLDRDTSGLLLVGRSVEAQSRLQEQLKRRDVKRSYLALVHGVIEPATGTIEAPIGRDPEHPTKMALRQGGRFARTHFERIAAWEDVSLLRVRLETGRTHQIRVHLSSIGAPLAGDKTYGPRRVATGNPGRVWLHAYRLEFEDPALPGQSVEVIAPLPEDLVASLGKLGEPESGSVSLADAGSEQAP